MRSPTRRREEAQEAGRRLGVDYIVLDNHDGELLPTLKPREEIIRQIRLWKADLVLAPRPNDYHPDHRYTGVLVQDAAYMVVVPNVTPDTPALRKNPVFMYFQDDFQRPNPFRPDVAVSIDDVIEKKIDALDAHVSQMYEWLPWVGGKLEKVPKDPKERKKWLRETRAGQPNAAVRATLVKWYGEEQGKAVRHAEAFEICEYGARPDEALIRKLFPFFPQGGQRVEHVASGSGHVPAAGVLPHRLAVGENLGRPPDDTCGRAAGGVRREHEPPGDASGR